MQTTSRLYKNQQIFTDISHYCNTYVLLISVVFYFQVDLSINIDYSVKQCRLLRYYPNSNQDTKIQRNISLDYEILEHPPYSPDISSTDYHLFRHWDPFHTQESFLYTKNSQSIKIFF